MPDARFVRGEAGILRPLRPLNRLTECRPLPVVPGREREVNIARLELLVGHDIRVAVSVAPRLLTRNQMVAGDVAHQGNLRIQERDVDALSLAGSLAGEERRKDGVRGEDACGDIGDGHARPVGLSPDGTRDAHEPPLCLNHEVIAGPVTVGPAVPVAGDRAVDQPRPQRLQGLVVQTPALHRTGPEILHQDVRPADQLSQDLQAALRFQVQRHAAFVPVYADEIGRFAPLGKGRPPRARVVPAFGSLHLDHLCAEIPQHHGAVRTGEDARQIKYAHPFEQRSGLPHNTPPTSGGHLSGPAGQSPHRAPNPCGAQRLNTGHYTEPGSKSSRSGVWRSIGFILFIVEPSCACISRRLRQGGWSFNSAKLGAKPEGECSRGSGHETRGLRL